MNTIDYQEILNFWYENNLDYNKWFHNSEDYDNIIRSKFRKILKKAGNGYFMEWLNNHQSYLALIILLNRFPKFIYRNNSKAFKYDNKCILFVEMGLDLYFRKLSAKEKIFVLMPYQNIENLKSQNFAIELLEEYIHKEKNIKEKLILKRSLKNHLITRDIIKKFSRFPERNVLYNRESSEEEIDFIDEFENLNY